MDHASIIVDRSQLKERLEPYKQNMSASEAKKFGMRVEYWCKSDLFNTVEEAIQEALNPTRKRRSANIKTRHLHLAKPESSSDICQASDELESTYKAPIVESPVIVDSNQRIVHAQHSLHSHLICSTSFNFTDSPSYRFTFLQSNHFQIPLEKSRAKDKQDGLSLEKEAYWIISLTCGTWLVHSLAVTLGGTLWNYALAAILEYSPILIMGSRFSSEKNRQKALIGAFLIFAAGMLMFLAPHVQTLTNQTNQYLKSRTNYSMLTERFNFESETQKSQLRALEDAYESSKVIATSLKDKYGENSWRTVEAVKAQQAALTAWKEGSDSKINLHPPVVPQMNDELRASAQEIIQRLAIFGIAFLMMFVWRQLPKED